MTVVFFGHRDTPSFVKKPLQKITRMLIEDYGADRFYVGNEGAFDTMVRAILKEMKKEYKISYGVVLAYSPFEMKNKYEDYSDTVFPEKLEGINPKYAIPRRNEWMIDNSDVVVTYVHNTIGGAYKAKTLAEKKSKTVINIPEKNSAWTK